MQVVRLVLLGLAMLALVVACWLTGCGSGKPEGSPAGAEAALGATGSVAAATSITSPSAKPKPPKPKPVDPVIVLHTSAGDIQIQLFREKAPQTVDNFLQNYASRQFYDGTIFHHVEAGSMIIGGGYTSDLTPKETRAPVYNESQNGLKNTRGMVAMIRDPANAHSATSQFFINLADNPALDCQADQASLEYPATEDGQPPSPEQILAREQSWGYCVFGRVLAGLDIADGISKAEFASQGDFAKLPAQPIVVSSVEQVR